MTSVILRPVRSRPQSVPEQAVLQETRPEKTRPEETTPEETAHADVVLVGFQDQGNLGMGYLSATLGEYGYRVSLVEFRDGPDAVIAAIEKARPKVVGFSLIFQFFLPEYAALAQSLRDRGVTAHFTIGGHYPSLCPADVLREMPQLDSVARFEGELTLLDLVTALRQGVDWHQVSGLAWLERASVDGEPAEPQLRESAPRALVPDLDDLPFPQRPDDGDHVLGWHTLPVLASRGCARQCSFCSIQTFYRAAPGKVVRVRRPEKVIAEMSELFTEHNTSIFLFQDDDFPLFGAYRRKWAPEFIRQLHSSGLADNTIFKISCRAEYVEPELFGQLRDAGLYLVYMGLESGSEEGMSVLHKGISVETNRAAIAILKSLGVTFQYGFMLFDPSSTFDSVRTNIDFLRGIVGDGSAGALFCRMLPYGGTPIRDQLAAQGRLRGDVVRPDYDFLDLRLNDYHQRLDEAVSHWVHGDGASFQFNAAHHELAVIRRLVGRLDGIDDYDGELRQLTAQSNAELFDFVERSSVDYERGDAGMLVPGATRARCQELIGRMLELRNAFVLAHQDDLLDAVGERSQMRSPIIAPQRF